MAPHPENIGKYKVEGILGRGGMGVVYKAVDQQIGRYVAIKMILADGDPSLLERFKSEARSTGSLHCPNIVTVYDWDEQDGNPYLVMQYLEGSSLESMLQKGISLTLSERLGIIVDVCNGLAYAHQQDVIHRDIKPANIMVLQDGVNDGTAIIVDFGIARIGGSTRFTKSDHIVGSVHYMSAEQLEAKEPDNRADIYATGVVLFQLLTGALPFDAPDTAATLLMIVSEPPPPLSNYLKEYPIELEAIVSRALAKKREDRYPSAKDFAFDLMQVQEHLKSGTVVQLIRQAEASLAGEEWTEAREQLQQVLRIDRQNTQAQKLMNAVEDGLCQQQQIEQAGALRSQADKAYMDQRYDDALRLLDQAVSLDPKNTELQTLRESVRLSKERATGLRRALRRADAAMQDGDLDEAQSAVNEALQIDPHDTQAKALQVIISQHAEERLRQRQLQTLLDRARNLIVAGDLKKAFALLEEAKALDPTSNELERVVQMALSAREQERRRSETEELRRRVESAIVHEDFRTAVAKAEEGLRTFPEEQSLIKLKAMAVEQQTRAEQKKFVREEFARCSSLVDSGQLLEALAVVERALQRAPGNSELETLRLTVQDRMAAEGSKTRKPPTTLEATLAEGKRILQEVGARRAREFLDLHAEQYAQFPQIRELYDAVRAREALDALDSRLASETNPARKIQLAEEAVQSNPDNPWIRHRLADLQQVRLEISAAIDRAQAFEAAGSVSEALHEWQQLKAAYPQVPEFELQIRRLAALQAERKNRKTATNGAAPPPVLPETPKAGKSEASLSATRMLDATPQPGTAVTVKSTQEIYTTADAPAPKKAASLPAASKAPWAPSLPRVPRQLANIFAGSNKYIVVVAVIVLAVASYLLFGGHLRTSTTAPIKSLQIHIITIPPDASVTSDSKLVPNSTVAVTAGKSIVIEAARLGYKTKRVEVRQESDGKIELEPEPLRLSVQTSEKSGTVELDGKKIGDLSEGNLDEYDLVPDGNMHKLSVTVRGKLLFVVELRALPGTPPQVDSFDANDLFVITSLGTNAKLYGRNLRNVQLGDRNIAVSPSGAEFSLADKNNEIKFGDGNDQGSLTVEISEVPTLAVHSTNVDGHVQITANVEGAVLMVDGSPVKRQRHGWQVTKPPGTYNFVLSAEGYESQKWTMALRRRQTFSKNVELKTKATPVTMASLLIVGGTPGAEVAVDGQRVGELDGTGSLQLPNRLTVGQHSIGFAKQYHDSRTVDVSAKLPEVRLTDARLIPWPTVAFETTVNNVVVKYQRVGDSQVHEAAASKGLRLPSGQYNFFAEPTGFQRFTTELTLAPGDDVLRVPLKLVPIPDYDFQDPAQVIHDGAWIRAKDSHKFVYLKPGFLNENLIFAKPGKNLFWNKKVEWRIEAPEGSVRLQYTLEGQKLVRKLVTGEEGSDQKEAKVDAAAAEATSLSIHIQVDGSHVRISNDKGVVLDEYTASQHDFSAGRIGIKTDSQFVVRDK